LNSILIDKNRQGNWLERLNASSVLKSTLTVDYEAAPTGDVPEPGSFAAASGLVGLYFRTIWCWIRQSHRPH